MTNAPATVRDPVDTLARVRCMVMVLWLAGVLGLGAELLLLNHTEGFWQLAPLLVMILSVVVIAWYAAGRQRIALRVFQGAMLLFMASGTAGLVLHFRGKMEFKQETDPALAGWALFRETLKGAAPPVLAPAAMIQFGFLGWAFTYRHPGLAVETSTVTSPTKTSI